MDASYTVLMPSGRFVLAEKCLAALDTVAKLQLLSSLVMLSGQVDFL